MGYGRWDVVDGWRMFCFVSVVLAYTHTHMHTHIIHHGKEYSIQNIAQQ